MKVKQFPTADGTPPRVVVTDDVSALVDITDQLPEALGLVGLIRRSRLEAKPLFEVLDAIVETTLGVGTGDSVRSGPTLDDGLTLPGLPLDAPEVWAAGVSYMRSREAREAESGSDVYSHVYEAPRPELFMKDAGGRRTVPTGQPIYVRPDSDWNVPEPELALVLNAAGEIVGYTIGNDVSSRQIEAENPLYLPQAKIYANSCALGPAMLISRDNDSAVFDVRLHIRGEDGATLFEGHTSTQEMKRSFSELVEYLVRFNTIADGTVLLTGTGIVPPDDFTLMPGHIVDIEVPGIGTLSNPVEAAHR